MKKKQPQVSDILSEQTIQEETPKVISHYLANQLLITTSNIEVVYIPFYDDNTKGDAITKQYNRMDTKSPFNPELVLTPSFRAIRIMEDNIPFYLINEDLERVNKTLWNFEVLATILF